MPVLHLREAPLPRLLVVRLGARSLDDNHLRQQTDTCFERWGIYGVSVYEAPGGDLRLLNQLREDVRHRRMLFTAPGHDLLDAGFPLLATGDVLHWSVVLSEPTPAQFDRLRTVVGEAVLNDYYEPRK